MTYAIEMESCVIMYIPSFIKIGSSIQNLLEGIHTQQCDVISLLLLVLRNKEIRLKFESLTISARVQHANRKDDSHVAIGYNFNILQCDSNKTEFVIL
jgi:hypothetical protein